MRGDLPHIGQNLLNALLEALDRQGLKVEHLHPIWRGIPTAAEAVAQLLHLWDPDEPQNKEVVEMAPNTFGPKMWFKFLIIPLSECEKEKARNFPWSGALMHRQDPFVSNRTIGTSHHKIYLPKTVPVQEAGEQVQKPLNLINLMKSLPQNLEEVRERIVPILRIKDDEMERIRKKRWEDTKRTREDIQNLLYLLTPEEQTKSPQRGWHLIRDQELRWSHCVLRGPIEPDISSHPAYGLPDFITLFFLCFCLNQISWYPKMQNGGQARIHSHMPQIEGIEDPVLVLTKDDMGWNKHLLVGIRETIKLSENCENIDMATRHRPVRSLEEFAQFILRQTSVETQL